MERQEKKIILTLTEPLLGTVPKNKEVYASYIATKNPDGIDNGEIETVQEIEEKGWTGFHTDEQGPFLYDYQVKGFIKETAVVLKSELGLGSAEKSKIEKYVYVFPRKIRLPEIMPVPLERPLRAMTMQGERVTLARSDVVPAGAEIEFRIMVMPNSGKKGGEGKAVTWETIEHILDFASIKGFGQWRSGGYGRAEWRYA